MAIGATLGTRPEVRPDDRSDGRAGGTTRGDRDQVPISWIPLVPLLAALLASLVYLILGEVL